MAPDTVNKEKEMVLIFIPRGHHPLVV